MLRPTNIQTYRYTIRYVQSNMPLLLWRVYKKEHSNYIVEAFTTLIDIIQYAREAVVVVRMQVCHGSVCIHVFYPYLERKEEIRDSLIPMTKAHILPENGS